MWYSGPGNGISHPVHMENFGVPGQSIVGCDSHTTAAGALGMLAIGAGGIEVAMAMAGEPLYVTMPKIWGIKLEGQLPDWVSAKDIVLELLRRHGVAGGKNTMIEYYGPGLAHLSAMDRHVLANMGTEMGATATVFPSDEETRRFLASRGREADWVALAAEPGCHYDLHETLDLSQLEPMIALPSSPDNVVTVREAAGQPLHQAYIGSSGNPGFRDFAVVAEIVRGKRVADGVSLDINPSSRQVLTSLIEQGYLADLVASGARLHQAGCNGCIGMGQAPAVGLNSLRTVPRNFPGRSGTREDSVFLCSPETAAASAIQGVITDPRTLDMPYPRPQEPFQVKVDRDMFKAPLPLEEARLKALQKTDNTPRAARTQPAAPSSRHSRPAGHGRQHLHRRHHARRTAGAAVLEQRVCVGAVHVRGGRPDLRRARRQHPPPGRARNYWRGELRARLKPRECRTGATLFGATGGGREEFCADSLAKPDLLRGSTTDVYPRARQCPTRRGRPLGDRRSL